MGIFKRIFMEIIRRPYRAITLALIILVLSLMSMIGFFLKDVVNAYYKEFVRMDGYSIFVGRTDNENEHAVMQDKVRDEILAMNHIVGYNNVEDLNFNCKPVNFKNVPYKSDSIYTQSGESNDITLYGNIDTSFYQSFRNGYMILKEGVFPSNRNKGVIIDSILADSNSLSIDSTIELYNEANAKPISLKVVGIYETLKAPEVEITNNGSKFYTVSPSSYIFCDYDSFNEINSSIHIISSLKFYVDEYDNIEKTYNEIKNTVLPKQGYYAVNCLENSLDCYGTVIFTLQNSASNILSFTYITSLIILFLMTLLWMKDHYYEAGIYIALGTEKRKVVMYFVLEIIIISIISLGVSLLIGYGTVSTHREQLVNRAMAFTGSHFFNMDLEAQVIKNAFSVKSLLFADIIYLSIALIAALFSSITIINYNTRKLFAER